MLLLLSFAFLAGIVTILSPCILPVLPIVLSGGVSGGKKRPLGIVTGFVASFTFFTLFLTAIVRVTGISPDVLRSVSVVIIISFGLSLVVPKFQEVFERVIGKLSNLFASRSTSQSEIRQDFVSGFLIGLSLGLVWTPCVGPILASVISLALTGSVTSTAFFITLAYATGTAIPMLAIVWGGRTLLQKNLWLVQNSRKIQKIFGVFMIVTALAIATNQDRKFQAYILTKFPQYGVGLTRFEDNPAVKKLLKPMPEEKRGKPMFDLLNDLGTVPELIPGGHWFNLPAGEAGSQPLTLSQLKGNVVLIDFWTYTCINCIRTLPYLKNWHTKYKDKGLIIIGVHTPEFEFEKNPENVSRAIKDFGLEYPVMQDNDYATWRAYENRYWPAKYLIDKDGRIRYTHFGEGDYDETETKIQELLKEAGTLTQETPITNPSYQVDSQTPELYLGFNRLTNLYANEQPKLNQIVNYSLQGMSPPQNQFGLVGDWNIKEEWAEPSRASSLQLQFEAREVFLVMRPTSGTSVTRIIIHLDQQSEISKLVGAGADITQKNQVVVTEDRLYKIINLTSPGKHTLYIEFPDGNVELYAFTFG